MNIPTISLFIACGLCVLIAIGLLTAIPALHLWQVQQCLQKLLEDPTGKGEMPRVLGKASGTLTALRTKLALQQEEQKQLEQRKQDLIAFLAHDLKTPLTSVLGYLELLSSDPGLGEKQRIQYTQIALTKAKRLEELINEFFDISTMDFSPECRDEIQLSLLLEQMADEFYPLFAAKGLSCTPDIAPHLTVCGDGEKLARVFDNVLRNAVHYSAASSPVTCSAVRENGFAVVRIGNEGLEIPEKELSHIFQKFYRLDAARSSRTGGAGLGLAIAKEIVEQHGGSIVAESTGHHAEFIIKLPLLEAKDGKK